MNLGMGSGANGYSYRNKRNVDGLCHMEELLGGGEEGRL